MQAPSFFWNRGFVHKCRMSFSLLIARGLVFEANCISVSAAPATLHRRNMNEPRGRRLHCRCAEGPLGRTPSSEEVRSLFQFMPAPKKPAAKPVTKPAAKVAAKPAAKVAVKPAAKVVAKPVAAKKPSVKSAAKPAAKPATKVVAKPVAKKAGKK